MIKTYKGGQAIKKKVIEKIPFIHATTQNVKDEYIAAVEIHKIDKKEHIILDVYKNEKASFDIPTIRIITTLEDYICYIPSDENDGTWKKRKISDGYGTCTWEKWKENTWLSKENSELIEKFHSKTSLTKYTNSRIKDGREWIRRLEEIQSHSDSVKKEKIANEKNKKLKERMKETPPLPKEFEEWCKKELFGKNNYLYYTRKGKTAMFICSCCGKTYERLIKRGESYEAKFENIAETPIHNEKSKCDICGAIGEYKASGKMSDKCEFEKYSYVIQKYQSTGIVIKYINAYKNISKFKKERYSFYEVARNYFSPNQKEKVQKDYLFYSYYSGKTSWHYHNISGLNCINQTAAPIYPKSIENLKGSIFQYSGLDLYMIRKPKADLINFLELYRKYPVIEILLKMNLFKLVTKIIIYQSFINEYIQPQETTASRVLGILNNRIKLLASKEGNPLMLKILQLEKKLEVNWKETEILTLETIISEVGGLEIIFKHMSLTQFLNRIAKYTGIKVEDIYNTKDLQLNDKVREIYIKYKDYLNMAHGLGYDLNNSIKVYPRNLIDSHQKMVLETVKGEMDKRIVEVLIKYPLIKTKYKKISKKYNYADDAYTIRAARDAGEIVIEGKVLHHCVGGVNSESSNYLKKHNEGKSIILFLRKTETPDIALITVEIVEDKINQWYGENDFKNNIACVNKWLNAYINRIKCKSGKTKERTIAG